MDSLTKKELISAMAMQSLLVTAGTQISIEWLCSMSIDYANELIKQLEIDVINNECTCKVCTSQDI
jgi:hypothetical protein